MSALCWSGCKGRGSRARWERRCSSFGPQLNSEDRAYAAPTERYLSWGRGRASGHAPRGCVLAWVRSDQASSSCGLMWVSLPSLRTRTLDPLMPFGQAAADGPVTKCSCRCTPLRAGKSSANADAQECQEQWQLYTKLQTRPHQRDSIETAVAVNTHQKSMFSATPADAFLTSERLGCRFAFPQPQSTQDCSGRAGCGKNALG